jgi:hypothetical protein
MARAIGITYADMDTHPEVRRVCLNVYNYLDSKGYTPDKAGLANLPFGIESAELDIPLDRFPTQLDVTRYIRSFHQFSEENQRRYWPEIFLSTH